MIGLTSILAIACVGVLGLAVLALLVIWMQNRQQETPTPAPDRPRRSPFNYPADGELEAQIGELLARGVKIEAIRLYREVTGAGLKESKDAVEAFERGGKLFTPGPVPPPAPAGDLEAQVRALLNKGNKLEAIKIYRQATGVGLKESKDAVEAFEKDPTLPLQR